MRLGTRLDNETRRKVLHMLSGAAFLVFLILFGRTKLIAFLAIVLLSGLAVINLLFLKIRVPFTGWFIKSFERPMVRFPGYATAWYVAGLLMAATILHDQGEIAAVVCALAFGDGLSAVLGERGKRELFYNQDKTVEGTLAFFIATLPSVIFVGWIGVPFAIATAIFESLPLGIDDNFIIPLAGAAFFYIF